MFSNEIEKFVLNGRTNTPRFSLFVSAHLMFGLVVILNKKITILHDELEQLRAELNRPYYVSAVEAMDVISPPHVTLEVGRKTPRAARRVADKKKILIPVVDVVVTLKENLPEYIDKNMTLDSLLAGVTASPVRRQPITMEDTFDLYDRSMLIPVEAGAALLDFSTDLFGALPVSFYLYSY